MRKQHHAWGRGILSFKPRPDLCLQGDQRAFHDQGHRYAGRYFREMPAPVGTPALKKFFQVFLLVEIESSRQFPTVRRAEFIRELPEHSLNEQIARFHRLRGGISSVKHADRHDSPGHCPAEPPRSCQASTEPRGDLRNQVRMDILAFGDGKQDAFRSAIPGSKILTASLRDLLDHLFNGSVIFHDLFSLAPTKSPRCSHRFLPGLSYSFL